MATCNIILLLAIAALLFQASVQEFQDEPTASPSTLPPSATDESPVQLLTGSALQHYAAPAESSAAETPTTGDTAAEQEVKLARTVASSRPSDVNKPSEPAVEPAPAPAPAPDSSSSPHDGDEDEDENDLLADEYKNPGEGKKKLVCYYGSWATYRPGEGRYPASNLEPSLCTHMIYSFAGLNNRSEMISLDHWNDFKNPRGLGSLEKFVGLKERNPALKCMVAIGGWNEGSLNYSRMVSKPSRRRKFVASVLKFLEQNKLDGLDMDWEYPAHRGGARTDTQNFVRLIRELRLPFNARGYLLSASVGAGREIAELAYDVGNLSKYLNIINLMTYDYHSYLDGSTGLNAPLYHIKPPAASGGSGRAPASADPSANLHYTVNYWLGRGAKARQIVLGLPLYGKSFSLADPRDTGLGAAASKPGLPGPFTNESGAMAYYELCALLKSPDWQVVRPGKSAASSSDGGGVDDESPYAYHADQWISYEDTRSLTQKVGYAMSKGLGGAMVWSIDQDDFHGRCHAGQKYPLLTTIRQALGLPPDADTEASQRNKMLPAGHESPPEATAAAVQSPAPPTCGARGQWWFPGPSCSQYYDCTSGIAILKECARGLVWNQNKRYCNNDQLTKGACQSQ